MARHRWTDAEKAFGFAIVCGFAYGKAFSSEGETAMLIWLVIGAGALLIGGPMLSRTTKRLDEQEREIRRLETWVSPENRRPL